MAWRKTNTRSASTHVTACIFCWCFRSHQVSPGFHMKFAPLFFSWISLLTKNNKMNTLCVWFLGTRICDSTPYTRSEYMHVELVAMCVCAIDRDQFSTTVWLTVYWFPAMVPQLLIRLRGLVIRVQFVSCILYLMVHRRPDWCHMLE